MIDVTLIKGFKNMAIGHGGKREGSGRKPTGNPTKSIIRRLSTEEANRLDNYDNLIAKLKMVNPKNSINDFKTYRLKGELVIKVNDLMKAGIIVDDNLDCTQNS